jgi:hypothetical protein
MKTTTLTLTRVLLTDTGAIWRTVKRGDKSLPINAWIGDTATATIVGEFWRANARLEFVDPKTQAQVAIDFIPFEVKKARQTGYGLKVAPASEELFAKVAAGATRDAGIPIPNVKVTITEAS